MGARQKLNANYFNGSLALAGLAGYLTQSWLVFWVVLILLVGGNLYFHEIRPAKRGQRGHDRK